MKQMLCPILVVFFTYGTQKFDNNEEEADATFFYNTPSPKNRKRKTLFSAEFIFSSKLQDNLE